MIKQTDILTFEDKLRKAARHRRRHNNNKRQIGPVSVLLSTDRKTIPIVEHGTYSRFDSSGIEENAKPPQARMRVLLRHAKTMKYIQAGERWTQNAKQAIDFGTGWWATVYAFTLNPSHLVIHYEFEDDRYNLHIPVLGHA